MQPCRNQVAEELEETREPLGRALRLAGGVGSPHAEALQGVRREVGMERDLDACDVLRELQRLGRRGTFDGIALARWSEVLE